MKVSRFRRLLALLAVGASLVAVVQMPNRVDASVELHRVNVGNILNSQSRSSQYSAYAESVNATAIDERDTDFSTKASAALPSGKPLNSIVQAPGGKWIVATDGGLVRLNSDGSKDTTYLGNYDKSGDVNNKAVTAMDVDSQGGAIISSAFWAGPIGRRMPDGSVDSSFAVELLNPQGDDKGLSSHPRFIKVLPNGEILLAGGFDGTNAFGAAGLLKLTATGGNVEPFNDNVGNYLMGSGLYAPRVYDIEIDSQGRILMAIQPFTQGFGALVRFNADGTPDKVFNSSVGAWLGDSVSPENAIGKDIEVLEDGGYLLAGEISGSNPPRVDILTPGHPWGSADCWDVNLFRISESGASDVSFNGTYDQDGSCGARTVVGGTFPSEIGFPNLKVYTGEPTDEGVSTGNFAGNGSSVEVDYAGNILFGGKFFNSSCCLAASTGLVRLTSSGSWLSGVDEGTANWGGWKPGSGSAQQIQVRTLTPSGDTLLVFGGSYSNPYNNPVIRKYSGNLPVPTVTASAPTSGLTAGGTAITITGKNFFTGSTVTVGGSPCTNVVVVSTTSITCTTPAGTAGTASILVTSAGQTNAANSLFTFTAPVATTTTTAAPETTTTTAAPVGPTLVNSTNQATLTRTPGAATALVNGQPVAVVVQAPADLPAAQVDPEDRSPAQVQALQVAANDLVTQINQSAGGESGLAVQQTPTGAAITGLLSTPVPIESTVLVEAGNKSTLFAALNEDGSVTEVQPGAVIEVLGDGQVGVVASGLTPGETVEFVVMSNPTLLGTYTVASNGIIKAQTSLPDGVGLGDHTLVVASPTVQASLGLKVSAAPATLPATGSSSSSPMQIAMWLLAGGLMVAFVRRRRNNLA